ncbi:MAG: radical SAM/SPASM domain-containing protein [bacterium]
MSPEGVPEEYRISELIVEPTSRCNVRCLMCPRSSCDERAEDMDFDLFEGRVLPYLGRVDLVDLTGWGEPLLHPRILDMVRFSKSVGVFATFITNGTLLDESVAEGLISAGLDEVIFSVDGASPGVYEGIRRGADFHRVMGNIEGLSRLRRRMKVRLPRIAISFVMMRRNIFEMPLMVYLAKVAGADRLIFKHLSVVTKIEDLGELVFEWDGLRDLDREFIRQRDHYAGAALRLAEDMNLDATVFPFRPQRMGEGCLSGFGRNLFIAANGDVSPCCDLAHSHPRIVAGGGVKRPGKVVFGNIRERPLEEILRGDRFRTFHSDFFGGRVPKGCEGCPLYYGIF